MLSQHTKGLLQFVVLLKSKLRRKRPRDRNRDSRKRLRIGNAEKPKRQKIWLLKNNSLQKERKKPKNSLRIRKKSRRPKTKQKPLRLLQTIERTKLQNMLRWQHLINLKLLLLLVKELVLVMQLVR